MAKQAKRARLMAIKPHRPGLGDHRGLFNRLEMLMKILLPLDGSHFTKRMLSYIAAHEELLGPGHEYLMLTVIEPIPNFASGFLDRATLDAYDHQQADLVLGPVRSFADQQGWTVEMRQSHGSPAAAIAETADKEKFDLIVMGTHGHSSLANVILGSVASGVLARCKVPVLLIR